MAKGTKWVPWYRRKDNDGNLTEEEKRFLESFRMNKNHGAAQYENLPVEVQDHISEIELALYDAKQDGVATKMFGLVGVGVCIPFLAYNDVGWLSPLWRYIAGAAFIAVSIVNYKREWQRNADGLWMPEEGEGIPFSRTQESLDKNWELNMIGHRRRGAIRDDDELDD